MNNPLSTEITPYSLAKFTVPTIIMMLFLSFYTMVDGIFVSRFVSTTALSAVNIVYPAINAIIAIAIMIATGGSSIVARQMGEGQSDKARENFSLFIYVGIGVGIIVTLLGLIFIEPILNFLGANETTWEYCYQYGWVLMMFSPFCILQILFQYFCVTVGKPTLGLITTSLGGIANIVLDYMFIVKLGMGISGAALATGIGFLIPSVIGIFYFSFVRKGSLYFTKAKYNNKTLIECCINGSSEMVTNMAMAITTLLFNLMMMKYVGEDGVAAITIILYAQFFLSAIFMGYSSGVSPLISYNYGNQHSENLIKLFKNSFIFIGVTSLIVFFAANKLASPLVTVFAKIDTPVYNLALDGMKLFSLCFLTLGINIFSSALFTALSNGKVSAILSFLRTFLFLCALIIILPKFLGVNGIWLSVPIAELIALLIGIFYIIKCRKIYMYY